jgi:hypothetical protein
VQGIYLEEPQVVAELSPEKDDDAVPAAVAETEE